MHPVIIYCTVSFQSLMISLKSMYPSDHPSGEFGRSQNFELGRPYLIVVLGGHFLVTLNNAWD